MRHAILGCGDVGRRIATNLVSDGISPSSIIAYVQSSSSAELCTALGLETVEIDLDATPSALHACHNACVYYTVPPQKSGSKDRRTQAALQAFDRHSVRPDSVVVISTTGVYGDHDGEWVDEQTPTIPQTDRGKRRLDLETQWLTWGKVNDVRVVVLRVPGIYAYSRLPRARLEKRTPVVHAEECGFSNRIHADDLAAICIKAQHRGKAGERYNATDGAPGKIAEYLQLAATALGMETLPEISMEQAESKLSEGMLSYLQESRKISNRKMLDELGVTLLYPDVRVGIKN